jgi:hypothetical protein
MLYNIFSLVLPLGRAGIDAFADCVLDAAKGWWRSGRFRLSVGLVLRKVYVFLSVVSPPTPHPESLYTISLFFSPLFVDSIVAN